jgi:hypothetical protein
MTAVNKKRINTHADKEQVGGNVSSQLISPFSVDWIPEMNSRFLVEMISYLEIN